MSEAALIRSVAETMKELFSPDEVRIEFIDNYVAANMGARCFVVTPGAWQPGRFSDGGYVLEEIHGIDVAVYLRRTHIADDRVSEAFLNNLSGLDGIIRKVIAAVHFSYVIQRRANELLDPPTEYGFIEPLLFRGVGRPEQVPTEFWGAMPGGVKAGLRRRVMFGGAKRIQPQTAQV